MGWEREAAEAETGSAVELPLPLRNLPLQGTAPGGGDEGIERVKVPGEK